jgi:hypothetical protein
VSVAASLALLGIVIGFGVGHSVRPEPDQHPRAAAPPSAASATSAASAACGGSAQSLEPVGTVAAEASSQPAKPRAQTTRPSSAARSTRPTRNAPKEQRSSTAAGAAPQPFPNLSFSAFTLPSDFAHGSDGFAGDSRSPSPSLPAHDPAPSLSPGLPNNGSPSGSSPNPALMNNGSP